MGFPDTLGHIWLKGAQNELRENTDTHRHSSKIRPLDDEKFKVVLKEGAGWCHLKFCWCAAFVRGHCKTNAERYFHFLPIFIKKSPLHMFPLRGKKKKKKGTIVGLL